MNGKSTAGVSAGDRKRQRLTGIPVLSGQLANLFSGWSIFLDCERRGIELWGKFIHVCDTDRHVANRRAAWINGVRGTDPQNILDRCFMVELMTVQNGDDARLRVDPKN